MKKYLYIKQQGFGLVEALIVVAILAILASLAFPSFNDTIERRRIQGATEKIYADMQFARSESIKTNNIIVMTFDVANACYGRSTTTNCNCNTGTPACDKTFDLADFDGVSFDSAAFSGGVSYTSFDPVGGTASNGGVVLKNNYATKVALTFLGRLRKCTPDAGSLPTGTREMSGYPEC